MPRSTSQGAFMHNDEEQIRELVATWMAASRSGDVDTVLRLIADDVVFLVTGRSPMRKEQFAAAFRFQIVPDSSLIDDVSEIQEIKVLVDWAFMWSKLAVTVTRDSLPPVERAGHTLPILKKEAGKWVVAR